MEQIINWFKSVWATVSAFFTDAFSYLKTLYLSVFSFLVDSMGYTVAVIQVCIVGLLLLLLLVFLIIAIINPKKRRKRKLAKLYKKQREIEDIRHQLTEVTNEISSIDLEISLEKKNTSDEIFRLTEEEKLLSSQENAAITKGQSKIDELAQRQKVLNEYLKNKQSGIFKSMKKAETTKQLISDIDAEKNEFAKDISKRTIDIANRQKELESKIDEITKTSNAKIDSLTAERVSLESKKLELEKKLTKIADSDKYKLTISDAKTITDEYAKQKRLSDKEAEEKALEELKKAKAEYEAACKKRVQTEKDTSLAIENVKAVQKERAKAKTASKKVEFAPITTATAVRSDDRPNDVNIVIADINSESVTVKEPETVTQVQAEENRSYNEPIVEVVDMNSLTEEEVVFIEAILEDINFDGDDEDKDGEAVAEEEPSTDGNEVAEEVAIAEEPSTDNKTADAEVLDEVAIAKEPETNGKTADNELIDEVVDNNDSTETTQETVEEDAVSSPKTAVKKPQYKDYGDGIPATPIGKKSKYQKPITKIIKKTSTQKKVLTQINEQTAIKEKVAYSGKWEIENAENGASAKLLASNGAIMIETAKYSTVKGLTNCIETVKSALETKNVLIEEGKHGKYHFKILSNKGRTLVKSAEYDSKAQCEKALDSTVRFAKTAIICD